MTGKRFELNRIVKKGTVSFWDNEKEVILNASHSLDLLNDLNNENEQLRIEKGNIQTKHSYELMKKLEYKSKLIDLKKENERLTKRLKELEE